MKYGNRSSFVKKRILSSPFTLFALVIVFVVLARAAWNIHGKAVLSDARLHEAQSELNKLHSRDVDLSAEVDRLSTPAGIEAELRSKYRATKNGESVAVIVDDQVGNAIEASSSETVSWLGKLLHAIGL
jgi:cell division protein FtsB